MSNSEDENEEFEVKKFLRVRPIPGKGFGVVALRTISPGDLVIREKPLIELPLNEDGDLQVINIFIH